MHSTLPFVLDKALIFFDLETTGTKISADRIIQIGCIKLMPDGTRDVLTYLVNPGITIPSDATAVHGISNEMVADQPKFSEIAQELYEWMDDCDLAGYNSNTFDVPMLCEEFGRCEIKWPQNNARLIDVLTIERHINSHKLSATYQRYTGQELIDAHDALADTQATLDVWMAQMQRLPSVQHLDDITQMVAGDRQRYDIAGKMYMLDNQAYWSFGKHRDKPVQSDLDYCQWVMTSDFPADTKVKLQEWIERRGG